MYELRLKKVREFIKKKGVFSFFISNISDISYLTGFLGSTAYLIVTEDSAFFITDGRYKSYCEELIPSFYELVIVKEGYPKTISKMLEPLKSVAIQSSTTALYYDLISKNSNVLVDNDNYLLTLRMLKDFSEIEQLYGVYKEAGEAFLSSLNKFEYGCSESLWAAILEYEMFSSFGSRSSFDTIIASGERSALPHARPTSKIINEDDMVTIDFGSKKAYNSDYTRIVYNGKDPDKLEMIQIVKDALLKSLDAVKPGIKCNELDSIARNIIDSTKYKGYFTHGLGHGVGLEVHEYPSVNQLSDIVLEEGMVFTIEPGVYVPGLYGVRLEDTVLVTSSGCEKLSSYLNKYVYSI